MLNWLKIILRGQKPPAAAGVAAPRKETPPTVRAKESAAVVDVDGLYYGWLLAGSAPVPDPLSPLEWRLLGALDQAVNLEVPDNTLVPRAPAVIPRLIRTLRDDEVSAADLVRQIAQDPVLVADLLRIANSPYYRTAAGIRSLEHAVTVLGRNGLGQLIAAAAIKPILNVQGGRYAKAAAPRTWSHSQLCAAACDYLGRSQGLDEFEPYLAGLLHDIGLVMAFRIMDRHHDGSGHPRSASFYEVFADLARQLSYRVLSTWELPAPVAEAMREQAKELTIPITRLGSVLYAGNQVSKLRMLVAHGMLEAQPTHVTCRLSGELSDLCQRCYAELATLGSAS